MKIVKIEINGVGMLGNVTLPIKTPATILFGDSNQGKTTFLRAIRVALGGEVPDDFISHEATTASITLTFDDGGYSMVTLRKKVKQNGDVEIVKEYSVRAQDNGKWVIYNTISTAKAYLRRLVSDFVFDQDYFVKLVGQARVNALLGLFDINTSETDIKLTKLRTELQDAQAKVKAFGNMVEPAEVSKPQSTQTMSEELAAAQKKYAEDNAAHLASVTAWNNEQKLISDRNARLVSVHNKIVTAIKDTELEKFYNTEGATQLISFLPQPEPMQTLAVLPEPAEINTLRTKIAEIAIAERDYSDYLKAKARYAEFVACQAKVAEITAEGKALKEQKVAALKAISGVIQGLELTEDGVITYTSDPKKAGATLEMCATYELIKLQQELAARYNDTIPVQLIDRAESLGTGIADVIKYAADNNKTVICTVVRESAPVVPESVGVFVTNFHVEKGQIQNA